MSLVDLRAPDYCYNILEITIFSRHSSIPWYVRFSPSQPDVDQLVSELAPGVLVKRVNVATYAHLDFTWAMDANVVVYKDLMAVLATHGGR